MTEFFREVQEDYRRDQAIALWNRYQNWVIAAVFLVIAGTAAWGVYGHFRRQANEAAGARYQAALQLLGSGKSAEAVKSLEAIGHDGPKGYAGLARLLVADQTASHDPAAGIKAYDSLVDDATYIESLKKVAQLRAAYLRIDSDAPKEFEQRYAALANSDQPYRNSFRELLALAALKGGDEKAAGNWLDEIVTDPSAPDSLRRRANAFLAVVQAGKLANPEPASPVPVSPAQPSPVQPSPAQSSPKQPAK
ncbi:MAG TPA: tetratricopeptide repeat protein [Methylovirgula sp.]